VAILFWVIGMDINAGVTPIRKLGWIGVRTTWHLFLIYQLLNWVCFCIELRQLYATLLEKLPYILGLNRTKPYLSNLSVFSFIDNRFFTYDIFLPCLLFSLCFPVPFYLSLLPPILTLFLYLARKQASF